jgi:hypothetical protein
MKNKSFCEAINCPGKDAYFLKDFRCNRKARGYNTLPCSFLDEEGKTRKIANYYPDTHRSEIQIIAALVKCKNGG